MSLPVSPNTDLDVAVRICQVVQKNFINPIIKPVQYSGRYLMSLTDEEREILQNKQNGLKAGQILYDELSPRQQKKINFEGMDFYGETVRTICYHHFSNIAVMSLDHVLNTPRDELKNFLTGNRGIDHCKAMQASLAIMTQQAKKTGELPLIEHKFKTQENNLRRLVKLGLDN